jgi:hypothetical protein
MHILCEGILQRAVLRCVRWAMASAPDKLMEFEGTRFIRDIMSLVGQQAEAYIAKLQDLRRNLRGQASINAAVIAYRVLYKLEVVGKIIPFSIRLCSANKFSIQRASNFSKR